MKPRHHLYLDGELTAKLDALASKPGTSKSAIVADALRSYLARRGAKELDDLLKVRLDRLMTQLGRIEREIQILLESLALFIRYEFTVTAPLPGSEQAAVRAVAQDRYQAFIEQVGRRIAAGRARTLLHHPQAGRTHLQPRCLRRRPHPFALAGGYAPSRGLHTPQPADRRRHQLRQDHAGECATRRDGRPRRTGDPARGHSRAAMQPRRLIAEAIHLVVFIQGRDIARPIETISKVTGLDSDGDYAVTDLAPHQLHAL
jgi:hypothetical protein